MIKGFKDFIMRGNVVDLAVAFVLGVAFAAVVSSFTDNIINPIVAASAAATSTGSPYSSIPTTPRRSWTSARSSPRSSIS